MTLGELQELHFRLFTTKLVPHAYQLGYTLRWGEALRSDEQAEINAMGSDGRDMLANMIQIRFPDLAEKIRNNGKANGIRNSVHGDKLALDLNLFRNGLWLSATEDHRPLGEYWESLHPLCRWGGRFNDGGHYSIEYQGRK
jgi:hypothetical protein